MQNEVKKPNKAMIAIIVVALLAAVGTGGYYLIDSNKQVNEAALPSDSTGTGSADTSTKNTAGGDYKDGTYMATGEYTSPGGQESIEVKVTLTGENITDVTVTPHPVSGTSVQYQKEFADNFKSMVVGKPIDEVRLSRVAGSSLTSTGFNNAIDQIKTDAAS